MKKVLGVFLGFTVLLFLGLNMVGCSQQGTEDVAATTTTASGATTTTISAGGSTTTTSSTTTSSTIPDSLQTLFNVSGATAIATATQAQASGVQAKSSSINALLKLTSTGQLVEILSPEGGWAPDITVVETAPNGTMYVGFSSKLSGYQDGVYGQLGAFFAITTGGAVSVVDEDIDAIGTWYGYSGNGELPVKQVQFDDAGNVYYLGTSGGNTILKQKATDDTITRIGSSQMAVRDFLVCPNGFVLFHGSNASNWEVEWLRVIYGGTTSNVFYNEDYSGNLRSYYYYKAGAGSSPTAASLSPYKIALVGNNLQLLNAQAQAQYYSGILVVSLDTAGAPAGLVAVYDDKNMYNEAHQTIGGQLTYGYWDPNDGEYKEIFASEDYTSDVTIPTSLTANVSEGAIRSYIREKYQSTTLDTLDSLSFTGIVTDPAYTFAAYLTDLINVNIQGTTWSEWRANNDLTGVAFANLKQLIYRSNGELYGVINRDSWGGSVSKGDKLFRLIDTTGVASPLAFVQDSNYKAVNRARAYDDYIFYLSSLVGVYRIYRLDMRDNALAPVNMTSQLSNAEIYSFSYDPVSSLLMYDVYDYNTNQSYLVKQDINSTTYSTKIASAAYNVKEILAFLYSATTTTTIPTTTTTISTGGTTTTTMSTGGTTTTIAAGGTTTTVPVMDTTTTTTLAP